MSPSDDVTRLLYTYAELIDAGDFDGVGQLLG
ncbi:MAG: nuclear transport factor 2 family protein, partial [Mycobacterium sp.]